MDELENEAVSLLLAFDDELFPQFLEYAASQQWADLLLFLLEADVLRFKSNGFFEADDAKPVTLFGPHHLIHRNTKDCFNKNVLPNNQREALQRLFISRIPLTTIYSSLCDKAWLAVLQRGRGIIQSPLWPSIRKSIVQGNTLKLQDVLCDPSLRKYFDRALNQDPRDLASLQCLLGAKRILDDLAQFKASADSEAPSRSSTASDVGSATIGIAAQEPNTATSGSSIMRRWRVSKMSIRKASQVLQPASFASQKTSSAASASTSQTPTKGTAFDGIALDAGSSPVSADGADNTKAEDEDNIIRNYTDPFEALRILLEGMRRLQRQFFPANATSAAIKLTTPHLVDGTAETYFKGGDAFGSPVSTHSSCTSPVAGGTASDSSGHNDASEYKKQRRQSKAVAATTSGNRPTSLPRPRRAALSPYQSISQRNCAGLSESLRMEIAATLSINSSIRTQDIDAIDRAFAFACANILEKLLRALHREMHNYIEKLYDRFESQSNEYVKMVANLRGYRCSRINAYMRKVEFLCSRVQIERKISWRDKRTRGKLFVACGEHAELHSPIVHGHRNYIADNDAGGTAVVPEEEFHFDRSISASRDVAHKREDYAAGARASPSSLGIAPEYDKQHSRSRESYEDSNKDSMDSMEHAPASDRQMKSIDVDPSQSPEQGASTVPSGVEVGTFRPRLTAISLQLSLQAGKPVTEHVAFNSVHQLSVYAGGAHTGAPKLRRAEGSFQVGRQVASVASKLSHIRFKLQQQRALVISSLHKSASSATFDHESQLKHPQQASHGKGGTLRKSISDTFFRRNSLKKQRQQEEELRRRRVEAHTLLMQNSLEESGDDRESTTCSSPDKFSGLPLPDLEPLGLRAGLPDFNESNTADEDFTVLPSPPTFPLRKNMSYTPDERQTQGIAGSPADSTATIDMEEDGLMSGSSSDYEGEVKQMSSTSMFDLDLLVKGSSVDFPTFQHLSHSGSYHLGSNSRDVRRGASRDAANFTTASVPDGTRRLSSLDLMRTNDMLRDDIQRRVRQSVGNDSETTSSAQIMQHLDINLLNLPYLVTTLVFALARKQSMNVSSAQEQRFWDKFYNPVEESYTFITDAAALEYLNYLTFCKRRPKNDSSDVSHDQSDAADEKDGPDILQVIKSFEEADTGHLVPSSFSSSASAGMARKENQRFIVSLFMKSCKSDAPDGTLDNTKNFDNSRLNLHFGLAFTPLQNYGHSLVSLTQTLACKSCWTPALRYALQKGGSDTPHRSTPSVVSNTCCGPGFFSPASSKQAVDSHQQCKIYPNHLKLWYTDFYLPLVATRASSIHFSRKDEQLYDLYLGTNPELLYGTSAQAQSPKEATESTDGPLNGQVLTGRVVNSLESLCSPLTNHLGICDFPMCPVIGTISTRLLVQVLMLLLAGKPVALISQSPTLLAKLQVIIPRLIWPFRLNHSHVFRQILNVHDLESFVRNLFKQQSSSASSSLLLGEGLHGPVRDKPQRRLSRRMSWKDAMRRVMHLNSSHTGSNSDADSSVLSENTGYGSRRNSAQFSLRNPVDSKYLGAVEEHVDIDSPHSANSDSGASMSTRGAVVADKSETQSDTEDQRAAPPQTRRFSAAFNLSLLSGGRSTTARNVDESMTASEEPSFISSADDTAVDGPGMKTTQNECSWLLGIDAKAFHKAPASIRTALSDVRCCGVQFTIFDLDTGTQWHNPANTADDPATMSSLANEELIRCANFSVLRTLLRTTFTIVDDYSAFLHLVTHPYRSEPYTDSAEFVRRTVRSNQELEMAFYVFWSEIILRAVPQSLQHYPAARAISCDVRHMLTELLNTVTVTVAASEDDLDVPNAAMTTLPPQALKAPEIDAQQHRQPGTPGGKIFMPGANLAGGRNSNSQNPTAAGGVADIFDPCSILPCADALKTCGAHEMQQLSFENFIQAFDQDVELKAPFSLCHAFFKEFLDDESPVLIDFLQRHYNILERQML